MSDILVCEECGRRFERRAARHNFCSQNCQMMNWRKRNYEKNLAYQKQWKKNHREAMDRYNQKKRHAFSFVLCHMCNLLFQKQKGGQKFCSIDCQIEYRKTNPSMRQRRRDQHRAWMKAHPNKYREAQLVQKDRDRHLYPWKSLVTSSAKRAAKLGVLHDLTFEWAESRWTGKCELTGIAFAADRRGRSNRTFFPSIDRIVPSKGYTQDNCRFVLWAINAFKSDATDEDMYRIAETLFLARFFKQKSPLANAPSQSLSRVR